METYTIINSYDERLAIEDQTCEGNDKILNTINDLIMSRTPFSVEFKSKADKDEPKSYVDLINHIKAEQRTDPSYPLRIEIASAVSGNMYTERMTNDEVNAVCQRIFNALINYDYEWPDIDEIAYRIQRLLDDGEYDEPNAECVQCALDNCNQ